MSTKVTRFSLFGLLANAMIHQKIKMRFTIIICAATIAVTPAFATTASAVRDVLSKPTAAARRAAIAHVVQRDCGVTLNADQLAKAAAFVESNRAKGVEWISQRIAESDLGSVCG